MRKIIFPILILFGISVGVWACSDDPPTAGQDNTGPAVISPASTVLKGSFESKFVRYVKGQRFAGQTDEGLINTVWKDTVWQNDRIHKQLILWSESKTFDLLTYEVSDLLNGENRIASSNVHLRFPTYVLGDAKALTCDEYRTHATTWIADALSENTVTATTSEPIKIWITVDVPLETMPGTYSGNITIKSGEETQLTFALQFLVVNHRLPPVSEWTFHLDLWQFPFQLATLCTDNGRKIVPFSDDYFTLVKPFYQLLAGTGQKTITTYIKDGAFQLGQTMVKWSKSTEGVWVFDYTDFDKYVSNMMSLGIDRQINCFSLVGWNTSIGYTNASGDSQTLALTVGSDEYVAVWNDFLDSFEVHLKAKGWFDKVVLYMDEIKEDEMQKVISLIKKHNPEWKIGLTGSLIPSELESSFYDYSTILGYERNSENAISTFYTSCSQSCPNNYVSAQNNPAEMVWMAWYAKAKGLNGYLRWAYDYWTKNNPQDIQDGSNTAGDFSMIYRSDNTLSAVPVSSIRLELLREGIQDYEKMRILSTNQLNPVIQRFTIASGADAAKWVEEAQVLLKKISTKY